MSNASPRARYVVVALPEPLAVGASFSRREWPPHVTLASPFKVDAAPSEVVRDVTDVLAGRGAIFVRFEGEAMFGRNRDVVVQIVNSTEILVVHDELADVVQALPGFVPAGTAHWRSGYRPHMTRVPAMTFQEGDSTRLAFAAVVELDVGIATVIAAPALEARDPRSPVD